MWYTKKCESCNKQKFFVKKRRFEKKNGDYIQSMGEICRSCGKSLQEIIGQI